MTRIKVIIHSRLIQEQAYRFSIYTDVPRYFAARNIRSTVTPVIYLDIPSRPSHKTPPSPLPSPPLYPPKFLLYLSCSPPLSLLSFLSFQPTHQLFPRSRRPNHRRVLLSHPPHDSRIREYKAIGSRRCAQRWRNSRRETRNRVVIEEA